MKVYTIKTPTTGGTVAKPTGTYSTRHGERNLTPRVPVKKPTVFSPLRY